MIKRCSVFLCVATLMLVPCQAPSQSRAGVEVWLTTADRSSLFAKQRQHLRFRKLGTRSPVIEVSETMRFQQMDGFGFALTGGSAQLLLRMAPVRRTALLEELFATGKDGDRQGSIGVSYLRVSIGSSDMNDHAFTYDDLPAGETDPQLAKFNLGPDLADVVPVLREILAINPTIAILGRPWSAPSWMKSNGLPKGGALLPEWYQAYAQYFVRYIQAMAAQGIPIRAITMQNEPLNAKNTPSMVMSAKEEATVLADALGPAFRQAKINTDVILYDHNCDVPEYALDILANPAASQYAKGSGFHLYGGTIDAMTRVHDAYPDKALYFTEQAVIEHGDQIPFKIANSISRIVIGAPRNWSRNVLLWNLAADPKYGPHTDDGGCTECQGAITLDGDQVTRNLAFYTIAHASRFVRPGSVRIGSESSIEGVLPNVAFSTPDHKTVLLVANPSAAAQTFNVKFRSKAFESSLGPGDVATYIWH